MAIQEFELYHGAVMTKLLRSDKPTSLRLIETKPKETWATYTLNDTVDLFISYSKQARTVTRGENGTSWSFVFSANQLKQMQPSPRPVWLALVCSYNGASEKEKKQICLLDPEQVESLIDYNAKQDNVTIKKPDGQGQLRVIKDYEEQFYVPQSRLDNWNVPGK